MQLGRTVVAGGLGFVVGHMRAVAFLYDSLGRLPDLAEKRHLRTIFVKIEKTDEDAVWERVKVKTNNLPFPPTLSPPTHVSSWFVLQDAASSSCLCR